MEQWQAGRPSLSFRRWLGLVGDETLDYSQLDPVRGQAETRSRLGPPLGRGGRAKWRQLNISCKWGRSRGAGLIPANLVGFA
jgi:hypothetical protein